MIKRLGFTLGVVCFALSLHAQKFPSVITADSSYIQTNPGKLTLGIYFSSKAMAFDVTPHESHFPADSMMRSVLYSPNLRGGYGFAFSYRLIDFSAGFRQKLDSTTEALYGPSEYGHFKFGIWATRKFRAEFNYDYIKGFANTAAPTYQDDEFHGPYPHRDDLRLRYIKVKGIYQFNPEKFSYRAAFANSERQLKSAGGFLLSAAAYGHRIRSDSSFIPYQIQSDYKDFRSIKELSVGGFGIAPGIGGTWTGGKFYLSGVLFLGADLQRFNYTLEDSRRVVVENKISPLMDLRVAYGFNNERFFIGVQHWLDFNLLNPSAFNLSSLFFRNLLTVGYRFDAPRILDKSYNWTVQNVIPKRLRQYMY